MLSRKQIIDTIEAYDAEIQALQDSKRDTFSEHRDELIDGVGKDKARDEIEGLKKAIQRRRLVAKHGVTVVEDKDALVEEILAEVSNAPRATRSAKTVPTQPATDPKQVTTAAASEVGGQERPADLATSSTESLSAIVGDQGPADGDDKGTSPAGAEGDADRQLNTREGAPATEGDAPPASSVVQFTGKKQWKHADKPHPDCLNGTVCGGFSNLGLCPQCKEAAAKGQVA